MGPKIKTQRNTRLRATGVDSQSDTNRKTKRHDDDLHTESQSDLLAK